MTASLSLWTTGPAGMALALQDGRVPAAGVVALAAPAAVPADAVIELVAGDRTIEPTRVTGPPAPSLWILDRAALAGAPRWQARLLLPDGELAATLELELETPTSSASAAPRVVDVTVEAILHDGERVAAADAEAARIAVLAVTAAFDPEAAPADGLTLRVDDPRGQALTVPADVSHDDHGVPRAVATLLARPFLNGDWTLSLFHDRTLLRRARLRLAHSPLGVRAASVLAIETNGARPVGPRLGPTDVAGKLVFAYALAGLCHGARVTAAFSIRDANGAQLAGWSVSVDRGDAAALDRAWFPVPPGLLASARGPLQVGLALDGAEAHVQQLELEALRFRSDGTVLEAPTAAPPAPGFGAARTFFGLVERVQRRRRCRAEPPVPPAPEEDVSF